MHVMHVMPMVGGIAGNSGAAKDRDTARSRGVIVPLCLVRGLRSDTMIAEVRSYHYTPLLCVLTPQAQAPARTRLHRAHRLADMVTHLPDHL